MKCLLKNHYLVLGRTGGKKRKKFGKLIPVQVTAKSRREYNMLIISLVFYFYIVHNNYIIFYLTSCVLRQLPSNILRNSISLLI